MKWSMEGSQELSDEMKHLNRTYLKSLDNPQVMRQRVSVDVVLWGERERESE